MGRGDVALGARGGVLCLFPCYVTYVLSGLKNSRFYFFFTLTISIAEYTEDSHAVIGPQGYS